MSITEILLIAVGLSADAFAVSISNGLNLKKNNIKYVLKIAIMFGIFQALMPLVGFFLGEAFAELISRFDYIIALIFLGFIGGKMIYEGVRELKNPLFEKKETLLSFSALVTQAIATSIDALVVGVSFVALGLEKSKVFSTVILIGFVTFCLSFLGVFAGKKFGELLGSKAEIVGGIILVIIGLKTFFAHFN